MIESHRAQFWIVCSSCSRDKNSLNCWEQRGSEQPGPKIDKFCKSWQKYLSLEYQTHHQKLPLRWHILGAIFIFMFVTKHYFENPWRKCHLLNLHVFKTLERKEFYFWRESFKTKSIESFVETNNLFQYLENSNIPM